MVNEDIITSLKNAIQHGESLESAIATCVDSGYNQKEVEEAAKFVGQGAISNLRREPRETLTMPNQKSFFPKSQPPQVREPQQQMRPQQTQPQQQMRPPQVVQQRPAQVEQPKQQQIPRIQVQQPVQQNRVPIKPLEIDPSRSMSQTRTQPLRKQSYVKEIVLLVLLLLLVGILILTVKYKEQIIAFFS